MELILELIPGKYVFVKRKNFFFGCLKCSDSWTFWKVWIFERNLYKI